MNGTQNIEWNDSLVERAAGEWSAIAGETLRVERIGAATYAFGSELACLRLYRKWMGASHVTSAFSVNLSSWYFRVEDKY